MAKAQPPATRLHIEHHGEGHRVVLTHGLGDNAGTWERVVPALSTRCRVTAWDLRGHGRSEAPGDAAAYSRDIAVEDLLAVIGDESEPVTLVGHSLGGYLSLYVALRHPELVAALVMIAAGPGFRDPAARERWNRSIDKAAASMDIAPAASLLAHQPDAWVMDALPTLRPPLVQIVGSLDERYLNGVGYVQRVLPDSRVVTVEGARHHPQLTHPDVVVEAIERVLD